MKNIKYIVFSILFLFFNIFYVNASCTDKEISALKEESNKIKIVYKFKGFFETEDLIGYSQFDVTVKNIPDDMYVSLMMGTVKLENINGTSSTELGNGKYVFSVNSRKCDVIVDTIDVFLPTFNTYSLDPLCEGIDGDDFPLCGKYYEYSVGYNEFERRVKEYRNINHMDETNKNGNKSEFDVLFDKFIQFVIKYKCSILFSLLICLFIIIFIIFIRKRKKRGVLE